eukprot:659673-Alexandrium_andersonii.AAC.1
MTSSQTRHLQVTVPRAARLLSPRAARPRAPTSFRMWARSASSLATAWPRQEAAAETFPRAPPLARDGRGAIH